MRDSQSCHRGSNPLRAAIFLPLIFNDLQRFSTHVPYESPPSFPCVYAVDPGFEAICSLRKRLTNSLMAAKNLYYLSKLTESLENDLCGG